MKRYSNEKLLWQIQAIDCKKIEFILFIQTIFAKPLSVVRF